jgi:hypothetical protein
VQDEGRPPLVGLSLTSPEAAGRVAQGYYADFLRRSADLGGWLAWTTALTQGVPREAVAVAFLASDEFFSQATQTGAS